jgi:hypothetical protein
MTTYSVTTANAPSDLQATAGTIQNIVLTVPSQSGREPVAFDALTGFPNAGRLVLLDRTARGDALLVSDDLLNTITGTTNKTPVAFTKLHLACVPRGCTVAITCTP